MNIIKTKKGSSLTLALEGRMDADSAPRLEEMLNAEMEKITIRDARIPVAANYTGELEQDAATIKSNLISQADHAVKWEDCVAAMAHGGATHFVEAGPGKTLTGFNRRIDRSLINMNVSDIATLQKTLDTLKGVS